MLKNHITKYSTEDGEYVCSWIQISIFGKEICFNKQTIKI